MRAVHLPLLPVPLLAAVLAFAACSRPASDEPVPHVIPPAAALVAPPSTSPAPPPPAPPPGARAGGPEDRPSAAELAEFERPVAK